MSMTRSVHQSVVWGAVAAALLMVAADAPPQTIDAGGLTFDVPASWKTGKPSSAMRRAQLAIPAAEGDADPGELVVFAFPGGAGTLDANLKRWQAFFRDSDGNEPKLETKTVKGKNTDVTRAETAGRYVAPLFPGSPQRNDKPNYRLLGAIVQTKQTDYFIRAIGPDKTLLAARPAFEALIASIKAND